VTVVTEKGIEYGWVPGENGWGDPMNENLARLSAMALATVLSTTVSAQPGSPSDGDAYIIAAGATGAEWAGNSGKFTYWDADAATWWMFTPTRGWVIQSEADDLAYYYTGSAWQALWGRVANGVRFPGTVVKYGTDVTGTNQAASAVTLDGPIGTGTGTPAYLSWRVALLGSTGTTPQSYSEAWRLVEHENAAAAREVVAWNPTGPVMGGIATNAAAVLLQNGDGARFLTRTRIIRIGNTPAYVGMRVNGTVDAPTQTLSLQNMVSFIGNALTATGTVVTPALFTAFLRENATASAFGSGWEWQATDVGSSTIKALFQARGGGTNIAELVSSQTTLRFIPATSGSFAWRNAANSADTMTLNEAGTTFTLPLVTAAVFGTDPGGSEMVRAGGSFRGNNLVLSSGGGGVWRAIATAILTVSGGNSTTVGGNAVFYGQSHATQANDIELRSGTNVKLFWDDSANLWTFASPIRTSAPTGGSGDWELGIANAVSPTAPNRTITIEIGGTVYYLHAKTTND
jgi:hypothetical protein